MTLTVVGIDPGQSGGIAMLNGAITVQPMPDIFEFAKMIGFHAGFGDNLHVFIEKAQAFPKEGAVHSFSYGRGFGELLGVLVAHGVRHTLVPPLTWTRIVHAGVKKHADPKMRTLEAVQRLFPNVNLLKSEKSKKPHSGIVDALAIAYYGRHYLQTRTN